MKIKNKLSLIIVLFCAIFLVGCVKDSPEEVVNKFIEAMLDDDIKEAKKYLTKNARSSYEFKDVREALESEQRAPYRSGLKTILAVLSKYEHEYEATIEDEDAYYAGIHLKLIDGEWKIESF